MEANTYPNRLKVLIQDALKTGAIFGFFASAIYTVLVFLMVFVTLLLAPRTGSFNYGFMEMASQFLTMGSIVCISVAIPSGIIGVIGGILVAFILAIWKKRISNLWASLVGLVVGLAIILIVNYFIWLALYSGTFGHDSFVEFIVPTNTDFIDFIINQNPFFIPSVIAVILSTFGAWKINKRVLQEESAG